MSRKIPKDITDKETEAIVNEISRKIISKIESMPPTPEEIEYAAAKTPEERRKVFHKYNGDYIN